MGQLMLSAKKKLRPKVEKMIVELKDSKNKVPQEAMKKKTAKFKESRIH